MKRDAPNTIEIILVLIVAIAGFLTKKEVLTPAIFLVITTLIGLYFFPIKIFITGQRSLQDNPSTVRLLISSLTISFLMFFSIVLFYLPGTSVFRTIFMLVAIVNILLFIFHLKDKSTFDIAALHFCTAFIPVIVLYA